MELITLEILPPPINWGEERITAYCHKVIDILVKLDVLMVNIPEIVNESRQGPRDDFVPKMDNIHFANLLKHLHRKLIVIPYKISVMQQKPQFENWVSEIYDKGIRHLVLVGGENGTTQYPGYTVLQAAQLIKKRFPEIKLGGITIFTRPNEEDRIIKKMQAGIEFFFSQIIFEAANAKQVLLNLSTEVALQKMFLPQLFLSVAIASKPKDIVFMKWLGVEFPTAVYSHLTKENLVDEESSSKAVVDMMLDDIFYFIAKHKIPIGFNVEHVKYTNMHLIQQLHKDIKWRIAEA